MKLLIKFFLFSICFIYFNKASAQQPTDCIDAVIACGNSNINLNVSGFGNQELSDSNTCGFGGGSLGESNSVWLKVTLVTSGTLGFTLTPNSNAISEDYDFFVFGPNVPCNNLGQAIRCSSTNPQAANQGNNTTGMNSTSTDTAEGPGANGNSFVRWLDVLAGETYFIVINRAEGNSAFSLQWTGTATFSEPPSDQSTTNGTSLNIEKCDIIAPFDDGFTTFNLEDNTNLIKGTQTDISITYHETESDANIGINELTSPYTNIANPKIIYARITNINTGCFEITDFSLNVNLGPIFLVPIDFELCDNLDDTNDTNGRVIFNLSSKNTEILNGQNPADINITYHLTEDQAKTKTAPLPNSYYNSTAFNQQIFVRLEDAINPDCKSVTSLNLIVHLNPTAHNHTILQCDEDGTTDGITLFNLNEANAILTGGVTGLSTTFYSDPARTLEVDGSSFSNTSNPQTIFINVINDATGCKSASELILAVSLTNSGNAALTKCDDDTFEDGFYNFDLSEADSIITNGLPPGLILSYFETYNDALLEVNNLGATFTNTTPDSQTIYARVENANNCYGISEVLLTVNKLPNINTEETLYYCLNKFPEKITLNASLINDSPSNYTYNWSTGETTYDIQVDKTGIYNVDVTNVNGCIKKRTITVEPSTIASFTSIDVVDVSQNNTITALVTGEGIYEYRLLDENNVVYRHYQTANLFENIKPGLYKVQVKDIKNNCGTVQKQISVIGFPKFFTPNNDGVNDTWQVYGISSMFQPNSKIRIFNRFGKLLKQLNPLEKGWNGLYNGKKLPADDYWFEVILQDGRTFKNHFTLKN